ncbi:chloride channel protein [Devosia rhodophyticola]|uniref:Chloride channel protein n=1 Tax=Devosia rhodophyticola TaxID=3026423 RepID=A0ABY7YTX5_9HYPH|nr:chloride channel protein [Devosia rhodophyticola]WDR04833.1 chloride channel protein [Devosia rhodophyticola]
MTKRTFRRAFYLRTRRVMLPRLQRRTLFVFGGIMIGLGAVLMAMLADWAQVIFFSFETRYPYLPLLVTPLGFAMIAWVTRTYFDGAEGSGIPQVMAARKLADQDERGRLVTLRMAFGKIVLMVLGLGVGASAGREGPTVQVGAALMFALGRFAPHRQPGLLLAGASAGVAAAFNAPLAGIMFGIEEMSRSFESRSSILVIVTVIIAGLTSLAALGNYTYFGVSSQGLVWGWQWLAVLAAGVAGGLLGGLFSRLVIVFSMGLPGRPGVWMKRWPVWFAALCGLLIALCGLAAGGTIFGTGYEQSKAILAGEAIHPLFGILKLVTTWLTAISGIPGGIFSPSLAVGAGIAQNLAPILPDIPISALVILCMAAYLSGVVQAPLTSFVIVSEMTGDHALIFPLMVSALIASAVSKLICPEGVYHVLATKFTKGKALVERPR